MATISITEILGSDNIASSRAVIANNFKTLCDEANKIETFLNTSVAGARLTVAEAYINQGGTTTDLEILTVNGRSTIEKLLTAKGGIACYGNFTMGTDTATATLKNVIVDGTITANGTLTTNGIIQTIDSSNSGNLANSSTIVLKMNSGAGSPGSPAGSPASKPTANIFNATKGQLVTILFDGDAEAGTINVKETSSSKVSHTIDISFTNPKINESSLTLLFTSATDIKVISSTCDVTIK